MLVSGLGYKGNNFRGHILKLVLFFFQDRNSLKMVLSEEGHSRITEKLKYSNDTGF